MAADPLHQGVLYAGSYSGIYQSVDSGLTWTRKTSQPISLIAADPSHPVLYAADYSSYGIVKSTDGFTTTSNVGPSEVSLFQLLVAGSNLFLVASPSYDVFVTKLDPNGNIVYSTYFGGSADDTAVAIALGADGSVYVTGATRSTDFPATAGAYDTTNSDGHSNSVFKLNPDGSLVWATYFAGPTNTVNTIAVDSAGNSYVARAPRTRRSNRGHWRGVRSRRATPRRRRPADRRLRHRDHALRPVCGHRPGAVSLRRRILCRWHRRRRGPGRRPARQCVPNQRIRS
jgi:hypothetical protein